MNTFAVATLQRLNLAVTPQLHARREYRILVVLSIRALELMSTRECPTFFISGSPASCLNGETCYGGIKCIAPPSISPTLQPTDKPPTKSPSAVVQEQTTSPPFNWLNTNGGMAAMSGGYAIVAMIVGVAGVMLW